jgi:hypothetical protein
MAEMRVTHESPTQMILEVDPEWKTWMSKNHAGSVKQRLGCCAFFAVAFLLLSGIIWYSNSTNSLDSPPWPFWVVAVLVLLAGMFWVLVEVHDVVSHRNDGENITITIDLNSRRAIRIVRWRSGKTKQTELKLDHVTQVLIHGNNAIHTLTVSLRSQTGPSLQVNSDVFYDSEPLLEFGKRLGTFITKPVVLKITEAGHSFQKR